MNECSWDYICPVVCTGRSKDCHVNCERHDKFRELREQERNQRFMSEHNDLPAYKAEKAKVDRRFPRNRF